MPASDHQYGLLYEGGERIDGIRGYLLSVVAAAVISGIVKRLMGDKGNQGAVAKLLTGIFLALTVVSPLAKVEVGRLADIVGAYRADGLAAAAVGEEMTRQALAESIKAQSEAYILDKAAALEVALTVEIEMTDTDIPVPYRIRLSGQVSPYAKNKLSGIITEDLGIEKERQIWT